MVERVHWGQSAILDRVVREDATEACTNYLKGREPAVLISGKRATESKQQMQTPQVGTAVASWQHQMKANVPASG